MSHEIMELQEKVVVNTNLYEVEQARSKDFSDHVALHKAIKLEKEAQEKDKKSNQIRLALKVANNRRVAVKQALNQILVDPILATQEASNFN